MFASYMSDHFRIVYVRAYCQVREVAKFTNFFFFMEKIDLTRSFLAFTSLGSNVFEF